MKPGEAEPPAGLHYTLDHRLNTGEYHSFRFTQLDSGKFVFDRDFEHARDQYGRIHFCETTSRGFNPSGPQFDTMNDLLKHVHEVALALGLNEATMYN